jgi:hypothetical protein
VTRYILNYVGGTKGDFLCNYINFGKEYFTDDNVNKSHSRFAFFKSLITLDFHEEKSQAFIDQNKQIKIFPAHRADKIPRNFLKANNIRLVQIIVDMGYLRTIELELLFKTLTLKVDEDYMRRWYNIKEYAEYPFDKVLIDRDIKLNDENRFQKLLHRLEKKNHSVIINQFDKMRKIAAENDIMLDYRSIFINKELSIFNTLFDIDIEALSVAIDRTWLPQYLEVFKQTLDLSEYGYRKDSTQ